MKFDREQFVDRIYYELQKDPKIKELQEQQRVNAIKAKFFDNFEFYLNLALDYAISNSYNLPDCPEYPTFCFYTFLKDTYIVPCYEEIGEKNDI